MSKWTWTVDSLESLRAMCVDRKAALGISSETLDALAGFPDRYAAKLLGPGRVRGFGPMSLPAILAALAIRVTAIDVLDAAGLLDMSRRHSIALQVLLVAIDEGYLHLSFAEDGVMAARMRPRWVKRRRALKRHGSLRYGTANPSAL
jgi:hypothetical protein